MHPNALHRLCAAGLVAGLLCGPAIAAAQSTMTGPFEQSHAERDGRERLVVVDVGLGRDQEPQAFATGLGAHR